jgi:hypothetical protein
VSHAFAAAGDYTVKVTARDGAGNEVSESHVVHVSAPVASPAPAPQPQPHGFSGLVLKRQQIAVKHGVGQVRAACLADTVGGCKGTLRLLSGKKVVAHARFNVKPGRTARIRIRLRRAPRSLRANATAHDGLGATKITSAKLKLRRS